MKRILLIICILLITTGCKNIYKEDYKTLIKDRIEYNYNKNKKYNTYRNGYKYYLPKYMSLKDGLDYNETIVSNYYTYYLYVDVISYYNNKKIEYKKNDKSYISYKFNYKDKNGYLEVNELDGKYLVEILYNYAKIEVKVDEYALNEAINNGVIILSTIKYDKDIINNLIGTNKINSKEESLHLFDETNNNSDFLDIIEEYDNYEDDANDIPDYEVIN